MVTYNNGADTLAATTLLADTFLTANDYYEFFLSYQYDPSKVDTTTGKEGKYGIADSVEFKVKWYGKRDLWVDCVEIHDPRGDSLMQGYCDDAIINQASQYAGNPTLIGWYLLDEPGSIDCYAPYHHIDSLLNSVNPDQRAITCYGQLGDIDKFLAIAKPERVMIDDYPLGAGGEPPEYYYWGNYFHYKLGSLAHYTDSISQICQDSSKEMWFVCQTFSFSYCDYSSLRDPTPQEVRLLTNLPLAYGARGIIFGNWGSYTNSDTCDYRLRCGGLVDTLGQETGKLWMIDTVITPKLDSIGPLLRELTWEKGFPSSDIEVNECDIEMVTAYDSLHENPDSGYIEIGTFSLSGDNYFMFVNRVTTKDTTDSITPANPQTVEVIINRNYYSDKYKLVDMYTREEIEPTSAPDSILHYTLTMEPGRGRLFKLEDAQPPSIDLIKPQGGEKWEIGGLKRIEWNEPTDNVGVDSVRVILYTQNGKEQGGSHGCWPEWDTLAVLPPESTHYDWEVPGLVCSNCKIIAVAEDRAGNEGADTSAWFETGPFFSTTELATAYSTQKKVCVDNSGNIYAVYHSGGVNDRTLFDYSPDNGNTWCQKGIGDGKFPAIVMDSQDGLDVFWIQQIVDEAGLWFRRKMMDWEDAVEIFHWPDGYPVEPPFQDHYLFPPSVAIDASDTVHICIETLVEYTDPGPGTYAWEWKLRYGKISVTNPEGIVLETLDTTYVPGYLPPPYDSIYNYYCSSIHLDRRWHPHITWNRPFWAETGEIYYKVKTDTGWSGKFNISESPDTSSSHPFIDIYGDFVNIVWEEGNNICHRKKWLYGDWEDTGTITEGTSPQIMDGYVLTYSDSVAGKNVVFHREFDRIDWRDSVILTDMYEVCSNPQMGLSDSTLSVFWTEAMVDIYRVGMGMDTVFIPWQKSDTHLATAYNNGRKIVRDADGRVHIVYQSDGRIYYTYTDDSLFSCDFLVGEGDLPSISLDSNEDPWILWRNTSCDTILFSKFDYDSFATPVSIYHNDSLSAPSFAVSEDDIAHISVGILSSGQSRVIYGIFNGTQFTSIDTLDTYEGDMTRPSLAFIEDKAKPIVVWGKECQIYYREKVEKDKWGETELISGEVRNSRNPQIDYHEKFVYVVWQGGEVHPDIYYASKPTKGSWTEPIRVANTQGDSKYPIIGGGSHVVWEEGSGLGWVHPFTTSRLGLSKENPKIYRKILTHTAHIRFITPRLWEIRTCLLCGYRGMFHIR